MSNQGTIRLKVTNGAPAIEKLWNGRFKLEFFCDNNSPKEDWYYENVSALLPEYGILQTTNFGSGVSEDWEAIPDSVYPDMRLVLAEYPYNVRAGKHYVKLTYETLTASWVEEKSEDTDYELNGLKRVSRTFVALPGTTYDKVVGTNTINSDGTTLYLGSFKIEKTEAKWKLTEVWLEAGTLSETLDNVGSQRAKVIETIGADPATPSGYSLASKQESDFEGFQTNRFTFLKNNVVLSESEDKVGSQLAITQEVFNGTPTTPSGYSIANTQESDVDGIPTKRFTFLKDNVELSRSEDKVGSQLAITTQVFNPTSDPTEAGYSVARKEVSDVDGIPTKRFTFLKPSILSLQQEFNNGLKRVSVQAFGMTATEVSDELAVITTGHELISQNESDYEGIKTSTFQYQIDESITEDYELNGLKRLSITELSSTNFTARDIGVEGVAATPQVGLYLGTQDIDNGGAIKVRESVWLEAGVLGVSRSSESDGVMRVTHVFFGAEGAVVGPIIAKDTDNFDGLPTISVTTLQDSDGNSIVSGGENLVNQVSGFSPFSYPGILDVDVDETTNAGGADWLKVKALLVSAPAQCKVRTTTYFIFQTSSSINASDYNYASSSGLWSPNHWASFSISAEGKFSNGLFSDSSTFRGYRTSSSGQSGTLYGPLLGYAQLTWQGRNELLDAEEITYSLVIDQGPPSPIGSKYTLDVQINPAFDDVDGNQYYKKTIVVTDVIPDQPKSASLPYS
jgi:hypothetical protein